MAAIVSPSATGPCPNGILTSPTNSKNFTTATVKEVVTQSHKEHAAASSTIDELLRKRAETYPDTPLLAYPASIRGTADFVTYTAQDLDRFAEAVARKLQKNGLRPAVSLDPLSLLFCHR